MAEPAVGAPEAPSETPPVTSRATAEQVEWLVDTFGATLYRVAVAIVRDPQVAEDVVQEVLVKAWTSMPTWVDDVPIRWARTVTRNTALSYLRAEAARPAAPTEHLELVVTVADGPDDEVVRHETSERMWAALGRLQEPDRTMLVMHEVDGLSYEEIALTIGVTVSSVKSRLYRARATLRMEVSR